MDIKDENYLEDSIKREVQKQDGKLSKKEKEALMQEAKVTIDFLNKVEEIELPKDNYVIFTEGDEQLYYENGEFYVISSTDGLKKKKKKTKKEATDMYLDYFIKYQLNPILDARGQNKDVQRKAPQKTKTIEKNKAEIENAQRVIDEDKVKAVEEQKVSEIEGQERSL